jgi:hypothetical protein
MAEDLDALSELKNREHDFLNRMASMPPQGEVASYANRFVAFLDVLGFREALSTLAAESPNELFHVMVDSHWFQAASSARTCEFQLFSDSIIVSTKDDHPSSFISLANLINGLRNSFLERGLLVRGAVAFGQHFNKHGICISPALVEAYELENRSAIYPRFVVSTTAAELVQRSITLNAARRQGIAGPRWFHVARDQLPVRDADGSMIVEFLPDTLEPYFLRTGHHHDPSYTPTADQLKHLRTEGPKLLLRWKDGLKNARARCKTPRHSEKVEYLIEKWNSYIRSFKELSNDERKGFVV